MEPLDKLRARKVKLENKIQALIEDELMEFQADTGVTPNAVSISLNPIFQLGKINPVTFYVQAKVDIVL